MSYLKTLLLGLAFLTAQTAIAQTNVSLGTLSVNPAAPIEVSGDAMRVDQNTGVAVFEGNVVIGQGDLRLSAGRVEVVYNAGTQSVSHLSASGGVTFVTATEAAEARTAEYDLDGGQLTMRGDVLLTQGATAIAANQMRIDLSSGSAQMDGNVRTIFNQGG